MPSKTTPKPDAEARSQEIALFRYGLISAMITSQPAVRRASGMLRRKSAKGDRQQDLPHPLF